MKISLQPFKELTVEEKRDRLSNQVPGGMPRYCGVLNTKKEFLG